MTDTRKPSESQEQARAAAKHVAQQSSDTAQKNAAALEEAGYSAIQAIQRNSGVAAEGMRHLGEGAARGSECLASAAEQSFNGVAGQLEEAFSGLSRAVRESAQEWRSLTAIPSVGRSGFQDLQHSMNSVLEGVVRTNLLATQELLRLASPAAIAGLQQRIAGNYLQTLLEGGTHLMRGLQRSAEQMLNPPEERRAQLDRTRAGNGQQAEIALVSDVMERDVRVAKPDDTVQQAAQLMREADIGALPVGEGNRVVGMVTDRDVAMRLVAEGKDPARTKVRDVMTSDVRFVFEDEDVRDVAENMAEHQVRRLPVMSRQKRLVGVISLGDVAKGPEPQLVARALGGMARQGGHHPQAAAE